MGRDFFGKVCRHKRGISTFTTTGSIDIHKSTFQDHEKNGEHGRLSWTMKIWIAQANRACDETMHYLFQKI